MENKLSNLKKINEERKYDYSKLYSDNQSIIRVKEGDYDINFIIGVKGRTDYFRTCLTNIVIAAANTKLKIRIVVVEQDNEPLNNDFCNQYDINYIYIPQTISNSEEYHSTSLMYNVGYLFSSEATYNMFHCCDTLISHNFFNILELEYLSKEFNWIQPYCEKRVVTMTPQVTQLFLENVNNARNINPETLPIEAFNAIPEQQGAPGGCILIPTKLLDEVGGYEPELFYGYTVEDSFIWGKLELMCNNGNKVPNIHQGNATYGENPRLYLYHLNHPSGLNSNSRFSNMFEYFTEFFNSTFEDQMDYVNYRREFFSNQKKIIKKLLNNKLINENR